jgi:hypothetical protein
MSRAKAVALMVLAVVPAGCGLPQHPYRTADTVRAQRELRLGIIAGDASDPAAERQLAAPARERGAGVERRMAAAEALLGALGQGELDLVYGRVPADTKWAQHVHLSRVPGLLAEPPPDGLAPRFAMRNGDNRWIMAVERARP